MKASIPKLLARARRNIEIAEGLTTSGDMDVAVSRAYYALFYTATALLAAEGLTYSKHSAVISAYGKRFAREGRLHAKFHRYLIDAFKMRGDADYDVSATFASDDAGRVLAWAREFLQAACDHLGDLAKGDEA